MQPNACPAPAPLPPAPAAKALAQRAKAQSALGDFAPPLSTLRFLTGVEPVARALVGAREWLPNLKDITGRGIEVRGVVGLPAHRGERVGGVGRGQ